MQGTFDREVWREAVEDALRGIAGGLLFGVPLLYTMEVWWLGQTATSAHALAALVLAAVPLAALVAGIGFRRRAGMTAVEAGVDVVTALGLGVLSVGAVLVVLQRITPSTPVPVAARMVVFELAPFALGAAVAGEVFARTSDRARGKNAGSGAVGRGDGTVADVAATVMGASFVALAIAPTEEVPLLASGIERPWLVVLVGAALAVTYLIVFSAGFGDQAHRRHGQQGLLQRPTTETFVAYLLSLVVSGALLWFFRNLSSDPVDALVQAVVLSFPAAIGGAAGRLVV